MKAGQALFPENFPIMSRKRKAKKSNFVKNSNKLQGNVGKYDLVRELANANCGFTLGQLVRRYADVASAFMLQLLGRQSVSHIAVVLNSRLCLLQLNQIKIYGTKVWAPLNSIPVSGFISSENLYIYSSRRTIRLEGSLLRMMRPLPMSDGLSSPDDVQ